MHTFLFLVSHAYTKINRNALACAVAMTALDVLIEENLAERVQ